MALAPRRCLQGGAGSSSRHRIEALPRRQAAALQQQQQLLAPLGRTGSSRGLLQKRASGGGGGLGHGSGGGGRPVETVGQKVMLGVAVSYMMLIVIIPFFNVFVQAFSHGMGPFVETLMEPDFQQVRRGGGRCLRAFISTVVVMYVTGMMGFICRPQLNCKQPCTYA